MPKKLQHIGVSNLVTPLLYNQIIQPGHVLRLHDVDADKALQMTYKNDAGTSLPRFALVPDITPHLFDLTMKFRSQAGDTKVQPVDPTLLTAPTAAMLADPFTVYQRNVAPFDRWVSDGSRLVAAVVSGIDGALVARGEPRSFRPSRPVLLESLPIGIGPNGSVGVNGAVTFATPLPVAYPSLFCYFIAGALFAGAAAGFYYTEMSSTTVGTVFNNRYTSGDVTVPQTKTPIVSASVGSYTQAVTVQTALQATLPGGVLGPNGRLDIRGRLSYPNSAGNKSATLSIGSVSLLSNAVPASTASVEFSLFMHNRGVTNRQTTNTPGFMSLPGSAAAGLYTNVDTLVDQPFVVQLSLAAAVDFIFLESLQAVANAG